MPYKKRDVEDKLLSKFGFLKCGSGRGRHQRLCFYVNDKKIASTGLSRGLKSNSDIDRDLIDILARELKAQTAGNVRGMIDCTVSKDDYIDILRTQGLITAT